MKKIKVGILIICILIITCILLYTNFNSKDDNYFYDGKIEKQNNIDDSMYYKSIIKDAREKYNNNDVVGILKINNTDYIVPIMQGLDNNYYLKHTPYGDKSSMGSIYLDYRVDIDYSKKLLIYGHNSSDIDMPFKILEEFYDRDYYDNHKYVEIITSKMKKKYEIFSVFVETSDFSYMDITFENDDEYLKHIKDLKDKSMYDTGVGLSKDDEILILQTCSEHPDYHNYRKKYLLIVLRRM